MSSKLIDRIRRSLTNRYRFFLWSKVLPLFKESVTLYTKQGIYAVSTRDAYISRYLFVDGQFEYDFSIAAVKFLKNNGFLNAQKKITMLDVGANIGVISLGVVLAGLVDRAIAIEPELNNFKLLLKNVELNSLTGQILCLNMAVGETVSTLTMELSKNNYGDHRIRPGKSYGDLELYKESSRDTVQVPSFPLVDILNLSDVIKADMAHPDMMWIDIQGYEGFVFKSAKSRLGNNFPVVSEIWPYGILRAGMRLEEFAEIVASAWNNFWVLRRERFIRYSTSSFDRYLDELGNDGFYGNVIFTA